jgi:thiosulfate dehydrogenase
MLDGTALYWSSNPRFSGGEETFHQVACLGEEMQIAGHAFGVVDSFVRRGFSMRRFLLGFAAAIVLLLLAGFVWVRLGFVDPRADVPESALERRVAMPSLDASLDRHAPEARNPATATEINLVAGMKIYQDNCAGCHGDIHQPHAVFGEGFYPHVPQFMEEAPDMPENQNFYVIQHGIRLSGMPAWKSSLNEQEMWQVTTFLSHMNKLPPQVAEQWKALASDAHASTSPDSTDKNRAIETK